MSLSRPFLAAGVPAVLGAHWDVDDRESREFFQLFHRLLLGGRSPVQALRGAQLAFLSDQRPMYRSPSNWAAFTLYGSG